MRLKFHVAGHFAPLTAAMARNISDPFVFAPPSGVQSSFFLANG
jgi:hypothetical protein